MWREVCKVVPKVLCGEANMREVCKVVHDEANILHRLRSYVSTGVGRGRVLIR